MCEPCTGVNDWHYRFTLTLFRGQIVPNQIDPFYSLIVSLFQCKLDVKRAFLASWLKQRGIHTSNALVSARNLKTREKFRLY